MNKIILKNQPISNRFLNKQTSNPKCYDMEFEYNNKLGCISLQTPFPVSELQPRFDWITCFEPEDHLDELVEKISKLQNINKKSIIGAFSFKDDTTLNRLNNIGFKNTWRIDPELDLKISEKIFSIETLQDHFNKNVYKNILLNHQKCDIFIARHVIEHSYDIIKFLNNSSDLINDNGYLILELPDCERAMIAGDCTILWEEHINYFTESSFKKFINRFNFEIIFWENFKYPLENSITVILKKASPELSILKKTKKDQEQKKLFEVFKERMFYTKSTIRSVLENFKKKIGPIALLGAGHLSSAFLSINEIDDIIEYVIDDNKNKDNMYMPNGRLKILNSDNLDSSKIKMCLLGANPQNHEKIIEKHKKFQTGGGVFKSIFPGTLNFIGQKYD